MSGDAVRQPVALLTRGRSLGVWLVVLALSSTAGCVDRPNPASAGRGTGAVSTTGSFEIPFVEIPGWTKGDPFDIAIAYDTARHLAYVATMREPAELYEIHPEGRMTLLDTIHYEDSFDKRFLEVSHDSKSLIMWDYSIGQVYAYDLQARTLRRVDRSKVRFYMHGNGSVLLQDGSIVAMGGYGFWRNHNFLLQFKPDLKGWERVEVKGDIPENSQQGYLVYDPAGWLYYVSRIEYNMEHFQIYSFDLMANRWSLLGRKKVNSLERENVALELARTTYSFDPIRRTQHLSGDNFFDHREMRFLRFDAELRDKFSLLAFYYRASDDHWILVGQSTLTMGMEVGIVEIPASDMAFLPLWQAPLPAGRISQMLSGRSMEVSAMMGGVFLLMLLGFFAVQHYRRVSSPFILLKAMEAGDKIEIRFAGRKIPLQEPLVRKMWLILFRMVRDGQAEVQLSEVDGALFSGIGSIASNSKNRSRVIELVNRTLPDRPIIQIQQSPVDKRYKMFRVALDLLKIEE